MFFIGASSAGHYTRLGGSRELSGAAAVGNSMGKFQGEKRRKKYRWAALRVTSEQQPDVLSCPGFRLSPGFAGLAEMTQVLLQTARSFKVQCLPKLAAKRSTLKLESPLGLPAPPGDGST